MFSVSIKNARFNAPIGLYPQEAKTGNAISVDITVRKNSNINALPFIDYTELYEWTKIVIKKNHSTLESIVTDLYNSIKEKIQDAHISIHVRKLTPPISGQVDYTEVSFSDE
ncbi:MAG TPA: dihydroneopterin aldolase [Edaphocola sp.]|nr:dihydroneopterin aldolase [Edaphocola sp.]